MVNQSRPHLLRDLNANSAISLQNDFAFNPEPEEKASELLRDLNANDSYSTPLMTPEQAYAEALRRIREAEETGAVELDLSGWNQTAQEYSGLGKLNRLPPELARLTSLQSLDLSRCYQLSDDLSPLASLTSLQSLNLSSCALYIDDPRFGRLLRGNMRIPLAGLTSLQSLNLSCCGRLSDDLSPLANLTELQSLDILACKQFSDLTPLGFWCKFY